MLLSFGCFTSAFLPDSEVRCFFFKFAPFRYGVTIKSLEILRSYNGSPDKRAEPKNTVTQFDLLPYKHISFSPAGL